MGGFGDMNILSLSLASRPLYMHLSLLGNFSSCRFVWLTPAHPSGVSLSAASREKPTLIWFWLLGSHRPYYRNGHSTAIAPSSWWSLPAPSPAPLHCEFTKDRRRPSVSVWHTVCASHILTGLAVIVYVRTKVMTTTRLAWLPLVCFTRGTLGWRRSRVVERSKAEGPRGQSALQGLLWGAGEGTGVWLSSSRIWAKWGWVGNRAEIWAGSQRTELCRERNAEGGVGGSFVCERRCQITSSKPSKDLRNRTSSPIT